MLYKKLIEKINFAYSWMRKMCVLCIYVRRVCTYEYVCILYWWGKIWESCIQRKGRELVKEKIVNSAGTNTFVINIYECSKWNIVLTVSNEHAASKSEKITTQHVCSLFKWKYCSIPYIRDCTYYNVTY